MASFRNGDSMSETAVTEEVSAAGENMNSVEKKEKDSIRLVRAELSDAEELHELQKACFQALLEKYQDYELNPAAEPLEKTIGRLRENFTDFYFIMLGNRKIGGVRIRHRDRECKLGPIFLLTGCRRSVRPHRPYTFLSFFSRRKDMSHSAGIFLFSRLFFSQAS